jgi:SEC-C motif-containing protein
METLTPSQLILARCRAFAEGDFGFIYDSYHPDSNFLRQFPDRQDYLVYGRAALAVDFVIDECRILQERVEDQEARVIFYLDARFRGERVETFELALLLSTRKGWRYHSGQKLGREEYAGEIEAIGREAFERVGEKTVF